jgi:hypothetical protein
MTDIALPVRIDAYPTMCVAGFDVTLVLFRDGESAPVAELPSRRGAGSAGCSR